MANENQRNKQKNKSTKKQLKDYAWYSGIAFEMMLIIGAMVYAGVKLDDFLALEFPVFKLLFAILSVSLSIYYVIKKATKK